MTEIVQKAPEYDGFVAYQRFQKLHEILQEHVKADDESKYISAIKDFLDGGGAYGFEFIEGGA